MPKSGAVQFAVVMLVGPSEDLVPYIASRLTGHLAGADVAVAGRAVGRGFRIVARLGTHDQNGLNGASGTTE